MRRPTGGTQPNPCYNNSFVITMHCARAMNVFRVFYDVPGAPIRGKDDFGQSSPPAQLALGLVPVLTLEAGSEHSLALTQDGSVWAWYVSAVGPIRGDGFGAADLVTVWLQSRCVQAHRTPTASCIGIRPPVLLCTSVKPPIIRYGGMLCQSMW
jgi:hypothetical protein